MMEIEVAFRLSRSEYVRALRFCLRKRHLVSWIQLLTIAVALALAVVMARVMERVSVLCTMLFVLAVMLAVYSLYQYLLKPGRIFDRDPMLHREVRFRFNGEDIARQDSEVAVLLDWRVSKVWRNRDFYFLFEGKESYILLPRRAFGSAEEEKQFERLVLVANPGVAWRNFG
ncbi:YcxB family protein [Intestinimonas massiliensis (ex Afouda et al. 2020)]|uniref:YcxB family protein n=2 Tax=Intestinimonas TaxID=1392389 RepID=UPI00242ED515|nr:YcxB family protein [Intestinimonas massiliensis (ex Afouda et al. 2020)]